MWQLSHLLTIFSFLCGLYLVSKVLREGRPPGTTLAWLLAMILIPYVGVPLYLMIGGRKFKIRAARKEKMYLPRVESVLSERGGTRSSGEESSVVERILWNSGGPPRRSLNQVQLLPSGETAYAAIGSLIDEAKASLDVATFILGNDAVGLDIVDRLEKKAQSGVRVRLMLDSMGSFWFPSSRLTKLKRAGGQVAYFMPVIHIPFRGRSNLRNHRKLLIADGARAILGGMNLAHEYMGPTPDAKRWVDFSLQVWGDAVQDLLEIFENDWVFASGVAAKSSADSGMGSEEPRFAAVKGGETSLQVVASGPDVAGDPLYDAILSAFFEAREQITIVTPYFIPDETLTRGLILAVKRGVKVKLLLPYRSNHAIADLVRGSYLRQFASSGVEIYFYPTMLHAKILMVDGRYALVGSANLDLRSLFLNYEVGVFIFSSSQISHLTAWADSLIREAEPYQARRGAVVQLAEGVGRIVAPLL